MSGSMKAIEDGSPDLVGNSETEVVCGGPGAWGLEDVTKETGLLYAGV